MSTDPFIGEIKIFGFDFAPRSYMSCSGQLLSIAQNTALFSLLGTTYGGNGVQTFSLPDLKGRMPIGQGQGAGLPSYSMGQVSGTTNVNILTPNMPAHAHPLGAAAVVKLQASTANADETSPAGNVPANCTGSIYSGNGATANTFTGATTVSGSTDAVGSGSPVAIMNPYLVINYSIAIQGIFPSRN